MSLTEPTIMGLHPHNRRDATVTDFGLAVSRELARRHPVHTAKMVARTLSAQGPECTIRTAENILAGSLSARTVTRLTLAYGLGLLIDAGAAVTGTTLREHIIQQAEQARRDAALAEELQLELTELAGRLASSRSDHPVESRRLP
jgi:2-iminoacetate synthase ThiH